MTYRPSDPDLFNDVVGKSLIAQRAGVSVDTVHNWARRDDWPPPRAYFSTVTSGPGSSPWWSWSEDIVPFLDRNPTLGKRS